ncbi:alpha/beta hydrolase [Aerococcaceae bacterium DSM 111022]|nr:alpha/beta hydrolase [Aerococcaceae bacterium DSM 111022]
MEHIYQNNSSDYTFILLHGTGGSERDLIPIAQHLNSDYNYIGIQGDVIEQGMRRYFKRHSEGNYDIEDLHMRGQKLAEYVVKLSEEYDFDIDKTVLVGFSNGANIAIHLLLNQAFNFNYGVLLHPMYPVPLEDNLDLSNTKVFASMGKMDPIVPVSESEHVKAIFEDHGASFEEIWVRSHQIEMSELKAASEWIKNTLA